MTNRDLERLEFETLVQGESCAVSGGYCGDLLSWVMGRAQAGQVWFTVMGNVNAVAVAALTGVAAVVLCNGAQAMPDMLEKAAEQGIAVLRTDFPEYEAAVRLAAALAAEKKS